MHSFKQPKDLLIADLEHIVRQTRSADDHKGDSKEAKNECKSEIVKTLEQAGLFEKLQRKLLSEKEEGRKHFWIYDFAELLCVADTCGVLKELAPTILKTQTNIMLFWTALLQAHGNNYLDEFTALMVIAGNKYLGREAVQTLEIFKPVMKLDTALLKEIADHPPYDPKELYNVLAALNSFNNEFFILFNHDSDQIKSARRDVIYLEKYGHLPEEVKVTITAIIKTAIEINYQFDVIYKAISETVNKLKSKGAIISEIFTEEVIMQLLLQCGTIYPQLYAILCCYIDPLCEQTPHVFIPLLKLLTDWHPRLFMTSYAFDETDEQTLNKFMQKPAALAHCYRYWNKQLDSKLDTSNLKKLIETLAATPHASNISYAFQVLADHQLELTQERFDTMCAEPQNALFYAMEQGARSAAATKPPKDSAAFDAADLQKVATTLAQATRNEAQREAQQALSKLESSQEVKHESAKESAQQQTQKQPATFRLFPGLPIPIITQKIIPLAGGNGRLGQEIRGMICREFYARAQEAHSKSLAAAAASTSSTASSSTGLRK